MQTQLSVEAKEESEKDDDDAGGYYDDENDEENSQTPLNIGISLLSDHIFWPTFFEIFVPRVVLQAFTPAEVLKLYDLLEKRINMEKANDTLTPCAVDDITPEAKILLATVAATHYNERLPYEAPQLKVPEILALQEGFQVANTTRSHQTRLTSEQKLAMSRQATKPPSQEAIAAVLVPNGPGTLNGKGVTAEQRNALVMTFRLSNLRVSTASIDSKARSRRASPASGAAALLRAQPAACPVPPQAQGQLATPLTPIEYQILVMVQIPMVVQLEQGSISLPRHIQENLYKAYLDDRELLKLTHLVTDIYTDPRYLQPTQGHSAFMDTLKGDIGNAISGELMPEDDFRADFRHRYVPSALGIYSENVLGEPADIGLQAWLKVISFHASGCEVTVPELRAVLGQNWGSQVALLAFVESFVKLVETTSKAIPHEQGGYGAVNYFFANQRFLVHILLSMIKIGVKQQPIAAQQDVKPIIQKYDSNPAHPEFASLQSLLALITAETRSGKHDGIHDQPSSIDASAFAGMTSNPTAKGKGERPSGAKHDSKKSAHFDDMNLAELWSAVNTQLTNSPDTKKKLAPYMRNWTAENGSKVKVWKRDEAGNPLQMPKDDWRDLGLALGRKLTLKWRQTGLEASKQRGRGTGPEDATKQKSDAKKLEKARVLVAAADAKEAGDKAKAAHHEVPPPPMFSPGYPHVQWHPPVSPMGYPAMDPRIFYSQQFPLNGVPAQGFGMGPSSGTRPSQRLLLQGPPPPQHMQQDISFVQGSEEAEGASE